MKLKNHYWWLFLLWATASLMDGISSITNFVEGNLFRGSLFLLMAMAFSFVSGILLQKAFAIHEHNKTCDWLHEFAEELRQETIEQIEPFEDLKKDGK